MRRVSGSFCSLILVLAAIVVAIIPTGQAAAQGAPNGAPPVPAVLVSKAAEMDISDEAIFFGRVEATARVDINARIDGYLAEVAFTEGSMVQAGDLLFRIESGVYEANVAQARANLASANAAEKLTKLSYERSRELVSRKTVSQAQLDQDLAKYEEAQANVAARRAELTLAEINLGYTEIRAPITGRIGKANQSKGSLVGPASGSLALLVAQDPIHVAWPVSDKLFTEISKTRPDTKNVTVRLRLSDDSIYEHTGHIIYAEPSANSTTNTITVRAEFPNPDQLLVDRQLVNVLIASNDTQKYLVIPQDALLLDQQGAYVFVVNDENKVEIRRITTGPQRGLSLVVELGLKTGDRVITAGQQKVQPGMTVNATLAPEAAGN